MMIKSGSGELVSVIVAAYNVESYIRKCIDSLLAQTYENIEIIVVDDGSTDLTGKIAEEYHCNTKVRVFHKENGGLSDARNYGLEKMTGEYVTFVDSDDYVYKEYVEYMMKLIAEEDVQIVVTNPQLYYCDDEIDQNFDYSAQCITAEEAVRKMLIRDGLSHTACGKLYQSDIWKELRFPYRKLYEDYYTTFDAFSKAEKVAVGHAKMYYYYQRPGSIMHLTCNEKTVGIVEATEIVTPRIIKYWPDLREEAIGFQLALCLKCLQSIYANDIHSFPDIQHHIKKMVHKYMIQMMRSSRLNYKDKVKMLISYLPPKLYLMIYNRFNGTRLINDGKKEK